MPIRIQSFPEPLSPASTAPNATTLLIESDALRLLEAELRRYCRGEVEGRSFLISGHRGAGKTTLVKAAHQKVLKDTEDRSQRVRPLLVTVNGPDLFPGAVLDEPEEKEKEKKEDPPAPHPTQSAAPAGLTVNVNLAKDGAAPESDPEKVATARQLALRQIVLSLHRAVAEEVARAFRERVREATGHDPARRQELLELAAQLEMELWECPIPARLREFWRRGGFLESGVLFRPGGVTLAGEHDVSAVRPDQGMRELLALASVCEANCRVSGTWTEQERRTESAERRSEAAVQAQASPRELFGPLAALLTGALAGVGLYAAHAASGVMATIAGIGAALGATAVFKYAASRSSARSVSRESSYLPDLSVETLDRFIPVLVKRLTNAGLPPVFLLDELDKVNRLARHMIPLLKQMKKFFAESAFVCFVTDRSYLEELRQQLAREPYPKESTYFTHLVFIVFRHSDYHEFLRKLIVAPGPPAAPAPAPTPPAPRPLAVAWSRLRAWFERMRGGAPAPTEARK